MPTSALRKKLNFFERFRRIRNIFIGPMWASAPTDGKSRINQYFLEGKALGGGFRSIDPGPSGVVVPTNGVAKCSNVGDGPWTSQNKTNIANRGVEGAAPYGRNGYGPSGVVVPTSWFTHIDNDKKMKKGRVES